MSPQAPGVVYMTRNAGRQWMEPLARSARDAGMSPRLLTGVNSETPDELQTMFDDIVTVDDPFDVDQLVDATRRTCGPDERLVALMTGEDGLIAATAWAAERLGVGRTSARAIEVSRNKYLARVRLRAAGEPVPGFALMHGTEDAARVAAEVGLPAVFKPMNGAGSHLVIRVQTEADLAAAYDLATSRSEVGPLAQMYSHPVEAEDGNTVDPTRVFLVESYLPGREFSVDLVVRNGEIEQVAMVDKTVIDERNFECGFISPPVDLDDATIARLRACVDGAMRALDLDNTVAHVELRDAGPGQTCIVEVNAGRPGGQLYVPMFKLNTGIDLISELMTVSCGLPSRREAPALPMPLGTMTKYPHASGLLTAMNGVDELSEMPDVIAVLPQVSVGDLINHEYEVFAVNLILAGFTTREEFMETYREAYDLIDLVIEPVEQQQVP